MASPTRSSSTLGRRSIVARLVAVLALAACGVAIYLLVMSFTEDGSSGEGSRKDKKGRSEQAKEQKAEMPDTGFLVAIR